MRSHNILLYKYCYTQHIQFVKNLIIKSRGLPFFSIYCIRLIKCNISIHPEKKKQYYLKFHFPKF